MNANNEIKMGLRMAGVASFADYTTLAKENETELRQMVTERQLVKKSGTTGIALSPKHAKDAAKVRKIFFLVAKELFLSGHTVLCASLSDVIALLKSEDITQQSVLLDTAEMLFILDFYEDGAPFPAEAAEAAMVRTLVRQRLDKNLGISVLSDAPLSKAHTWWPLSFLGIIEEHTVSLTR